MQINTFLRNTIFGGLMLVLFVTPFIISSSLFFPYISGKGFFFRLVVEICFALWILLLVRDTKYWPKKSQILYAALAFAVVLILSTVFSVNPLRSMWSNFERMEGLVSYLHLFAYFIMLVSLAGAVEGEKRRRFWMIVWHTTLAASLVMTIQGLRQIYDPSLNSGQSGIRVDGTFGNAAYMAVYFLIHIFLNLYLFIKAKGVVWQRWCYGILAALQFYVLFYTQTRGAIGGTLIGLILALLVIAIGKGGKLRNYTIGGIALIILLWGGLVLAKNSKFVTSSPALSRFAGISLTERTVRSRTTIWSMAVEGVAEHPVLGYGLDNFNLVFNKYYKPALYDQEQWFDRAHNVFFDWLSAAGILGLLSYLSLFVLALVVIWKRKEGDIEDRAILTGLLAAYFIHNFFVFDNLLSSVLFFTLLAYLGTHDAEHHANANFRSLTSGPQKSDFKTHDERNLTLRYAAGTVLFLVMFPVIYMVTYKPYVAGKTLIVAISPCSKENTVRQQQQDGSFKLVCTESRQAAAERSIASFNKIFELNTFANTEAREQLVQTALQTGGNNQVSEATRQSFLELAMTQMQKQVEMTPNDARYRLFMGMFFRSVGQLDLAIGELTEAVKLTPGKQSMLGNLGQLYAEKKDYPKAIEVLKASYALDVHNAEAGRMLFAAYLQSGDRKSAVGVIEQMIQVDPNFKTQGEQYIKDVQAGKNP